MIAQLMVLAGIFGIAYILQPDQISEVKKDVEKVEVNISPIDMWEMKKMWGDK